MNRGWALALLVCAGAMVTASVSGQTQQEAAAILAKAREALGGEKKLQSIRTIVATGETRQVRGENLVPIVFEMNIERPDKYARRDETPAVESGYSTSGFVGPDLVLMPVPPTVPPAPQRAARVKTLKQDYARLMLGLFAASTDAYPLEFARIGIAESPQGKADVLLVTGPDDFKVSFLINQETHLPVMVSWLPPAPPARGAMPPGAAGRTGAPPAAAGAPAGPPAAPVEQRLYFADYRDAGGANWPYRLRRASGSETTEETTFDRFRLNAKIDPRKFEVVK
jgi:hypothetical protein